MIGRTKSDTPPAMIPRYAIRLSSFGKKGCKIPLSNDARENDIPLLIPQTRRNAMKCLFRRNLRIWEVKDCVWTLEAAASCLERLGGVGGLAGKATYVATSVATANAVCAMM